MDPDAPRPGAAPGSSPLRNDDVAAPTPFEPISSGGPADSLTSRELPPGDRPSGPSRLFGSVKQKATTQLNEQKHRATDELGQIAQAARASTARLRDEHHDLVAQVVERAADQLERFAGHLRQRDIDDLLAEVEQFGRRQPVLFIGSTFAAGLLAARFLKASTGRVAEDRIWYKEGRG